MAESRSDSTVDATVVIPTFNRWDALMQTLTALERIHYPRYRWEVVVVDDGSTEIAAPELLERIKAAVINIRYFSQINSGPAAARNQGAAAARGRNLIFIDNDIAVRPNFVSAHVQTLDANPGCWILGRVTHPTKLRDTPFGRYRDSLFEAFHLAHDPERLSNTDGMSTQNVSMPREDFERLGGFDESFTIASCEDWELALRARELGTRVLYHPGIVVTHNDWAVNLDTFCERQRLYSISDVLLGHKYGARSPRARLVRENSPVDWHNDSALLIARKLLKRVLATRPGRGLLRTVCRVAERLVPDSKLNHRAYDLAVGVSILSGVREGLKRYGSLRHEQPGQDQRQVLRSQHESRYSVCHLIDNNYDTPYFRSIASNSDSTRFPVMIGSVAPGGALQKAMTDSLTPTFSLGAANRWKFPLAILRLARLLRDEKVAVLHAHCFDATVVGLIAARLARVRFVFTRHHSDHNIRLGKRSHTRIDAWCAKHADHVIAVSQATRQVMTGIEGAPSEKITVVYNGMEPLREPAPEEATALRIELGLGDEAVCLMLARLHEEKGHKYLFDAIPGIQSNNPEVVFLLAGHGPHRGHLEADIRARGLQDSVRFLGRRDDVACLISIASVVVLPSLAESFGFVILEAMSLGKPVVAAATGGIPELVTDGEDGLLVPAANSAALADAVSKVIQDPIWARALGERGRVRVPAFSFERMMRGYESVYSSVLKAAGSELFDNRPSAKSVGSGTIAG